VAGKVSFYAAMTDMAAMKWAVTFEPLISLHNTCSVGDRWHWVVLGAGDAAKRP